MNMESKFAVLGGIYDLVRENPSPTKTIVTTNELILHMTLPWDEIVACLKELYNEGYLLLQQLSVTVISITDKGIEMAASGLPPQADNLRNLRYPS